MALEPSGRHVEEDGALVIGRVERGEDVCRSWGVETRVVGVVNLDRVVRPVVEKRGIPRHWSLLVFASDESVELAITLILDIWVYFLSVVRLAERIVDFDVTF